MIIRPVDPSDRPEWLRLRQALWPDASPAEHGREMGALLESIGDTAVFVAERPGGGPGDRPLAGFVEAGTRLYAEGCESSPVGYVEGWYVDADVRRSGVGRALVEAAEAWARARGLQEMASDTQIGNETGYQAHLALGYEEAERIICFRKALGTGDGAG